MNNKKCGLGIRDLAILNEVLLEMWSWRRFRDGAHREMSYWGKVWGSRRGGASVSKGWIWSRWGMKSIKERVGGS